MQFGKTLLVLVLYMNYYFIVAWETVILVVFVPCLLPMGLVLLNGNLPPYAIYMSYIISDSYLESIIYHNIASANIGKIGGINSSSEHTSYYTYWSFATAFIYTKIYGGLI